jgi:hypothetical protein
MALRDLCSSDLRWAGIEGRGTVSHSRGCTDRQTDLDSIFDAYAFAHGDSHEDCHLDADPYADKDTFAHDDAKSCHTDILCL